MEITLTTLQKPASNKASIVGIPRPGEKPFAVESGQGVDRGGASLRQRPESMRPKFSECPGKQDVLIEMLPLVKRIAVKVRRHLPTHVEVEDLISDGVLGLFDAVSKFDARRRVKLGTYARHRIHGAILDSLRTADPASRDTRRRYKSVEKLYCKLESKFKQPVKDEEMAAAAGINLEQWHRRLIEIQNAGLRCDSRVLSAGPISKSQAGDADLLMDGCEDPFELCYHREQREILSKAVSGLPQREQQVISLHYQAGWTMKRIALLLHVDESRVSQIHSAALARLKARVDSILHPKTVDISGSSSRITKAATRAESTSFRALERSSC